ncbi:hypothetical protein WDW89_13470 [Deltaproteobacteria bacterium TL4]
MSAQDQGEHTGSPLQIVAENMTNPKKRKTHIQSVKDGSYEEILPKTLAPSLFS